MAKITAPQPTIFSSDPLEQIAMKGTMGGPAESGLAYMFLNAFGNRRRMDQDAYMEGVSQAQKLETLLAQLEMQNKMDQELLKGGVSLSKEGYLPSNMPIMSKLMSNTGTGDQTANLLMDLLKAKAQQARMSGSSGGGGDGVKDQIKIDEGPGGVGFITRTFKGSGAEDRAKKFMPSDPTAGRMDPRTAQERLKKYGE